MDRVAVVADGVESQTKRDRPSMWLFLAMAFVFGLACGVLVSSAPQYDDAPMEQTVIPPEVTTTADVQRESAGLGLVVPGWSDTLLAIADSDSGVLRHLAWPGDSRLVERAMFGGESPRADVSGRMLAALVRSADSRADILLRGSFDAMIPLASAVTSFAWHDTDARRLGYTTVVDGQWRLWVVLPDGTSVPVTSKEDKVGELVTWGNWGFAIQTSGGDAWLLTRDGETRTVRPGIIYDSHDSGWIAIVDERIELVSSGGGTRWVDVPLDSLGSVYDMAFSPDGDSLAISASDGMGVVPLANNGRLIRFQPGVDGFIEWSTDQRFVLFAAPRGVFIQDLAAGTRHHILGSYSVLEVAASTVAPNS
jgi:hypothetical protein